MNEILKQIQVKLKEKFSYVEENWGQIKLLNPPVEYPCFLIDCSTITYSNLGNNIHQTNSFPQEGIMNIELTIGLLKLKNETQKTEDKEWLIYELIDEANELLQGQIIGNSRLIRTDLKRIDRTDEIQEYCISYTLAVHNI